MTISSETRRWEYTGDGSTTTFSFDNKIFTTADLSVYVGDTLTTAYSVTGAGNESGGNVVFNSAPSNLAKIVIVRNLSKTQGVDYPTAGPFPSLVTENALDRLTILVQQIQEEMDRCAKLAVTDTDGFTGNIPNLALRKNKMLSFDELGEPQTNISSYDLANLLNNLLVGTNISGYSTVIETHTGSEFDGANKITLSQSYTPGNNNLLVFRNGQLLRKGSGFDYTETSSTEVTLTYDPNDTDTYLFLIGVLSAAGSTDAANVTYTPAGTGAVATTVQAVLRNTVSVTDFGADPTGAADSAAAIQAAIEYASSNGLSVKGAKGTYKISASLIIPQNTLAPTFATSNVFTLDFENSTFLMSVDTPLFQTSNWGTARDSLYSVGIVLKNFGIESSIGNLTATAIRIQDWHQQCQLLNVTSNVNEALLHADNCFYMQFDNLLGSIVGTKTGTRFYWEGATNLCKISNLVAGNSVKGYVFDGAVTATSITNMSLEGQTTGMEFNATVYDVAIRDCYIESISDTAIVFNSYAQGVDIQNNYVNFLASSTTYFIYYNPLPGTNINIAANNSYTNMPSNANIIKNREDTYGHGITIGMPGISSTDRSLMLVDNTVFGANIDYSQVIRYPNFKANVVNNYAVGNYSGSYSDGYNNENGFSWTDLTSTTLQLQTKIKQNLLQLVYVNIEVNFSGGPTYLKGFMVGNQFFETTAASLAPSTDLAGSTDGSGFLQIDGGYFFAATITSVVGEIRLI